MMADVRWTVAESNYRGVLLTIRVSIVGVACSMAHRHLVVPLSPDQAAALAEDLANVATVMERR